ncbi:MAG: hypothetical protein R3E01_23865 [Pirellulaceae bacterium]
MSNSQDVPGKRPAITDSPWFWASLFCWGAIVALLLAEPRFRGRQAQIERQYQARQRSGQTVSPNGQYEPISAPGATIFNLRPLLIAVASLMFVSWVVFWWYHMRGIRSARDKVRHQAQATRPPP